MPKKEILLQINNEEQLNELCQRIVDRLTNNGSVSRQGHYGISNKQLFYAIESAILNTKDPLPELDTLTYLSWDAENDNFHEITNEDIETWNKAIYGESFWNIDALFSFKEIDEIENFINKSIAIQKEFQEYPYKRKEASRYIQNPKVREIILRKYNSKCVWCGATDNLTIDHILPVKLGGSNDEKNLQVLCRSCNSCKGCRKGKKK